MEDIRLPSKIEVLVNPANMEAFGRVQALAQNPRARAIVPLHKKLITFIKTFQYKWRSPDVRLAEQHLQSSSAATTAATAAAAATAPAEPAETYTEPTVCFLPKPGVPIHRPLLSITAYLSSVNICLGAYEERLGVKVRSETLDSTAAAAAASAKRARTESGSEKRSPETKKQKPQSSPAHDKSMDELAEASSHVKLESSSGDELSEEINDLLTSTSAGGAAEPAEIAAPPPPAPPAPPAPAPAPAPAPTRAKRSDGPGAGGGKGARAAAAARNFKPLLSDDVIKRIRRGWTIANSADITIGDLYVVLGQDSKLELEYYWCEPEVSTSSSATGVSATTSSSSSSSASTSLPYNANDCDSVERVKAINTASVSNKLKHLLLVANLSERVRKRQCSCGHSCDRKRDLITKARCMSNMGGAGPGAAAGGAAPAASGNSGDGNEVVFRTPMLPVRRPMVNIIDPVRQLSKVRITFKIVD